MAKKIKSAGAPGQQLAGLLGRLGDRAFSSLDLLPGRTMEEKILRLALQGPPQGIVPEALAADFRVLTELLRDWPDTAARVVVFGGGTGLSNIIGGDSRSPSWPGDAFGGLKRHFPRLTSIVCVTDDGGSTGELLKDLPLIALGDIRHVLLSSVREEKLQELCAGTRLDPQLVAAALFELLNLRLDAAIPGQVQELAAGQGSVWPRLPRVTAAFLRKMLALLAPDAPLGFLSRRRHCLGNLLLAAAIARCHHARTRQWPGPESSFSSPDVLGGIQSFARAIGAGTEAVLPCTTTPSRLQVLYGNGVLVTGESKSAEADRGSPVERVLTAFASPPEVPSAVIAAIRAADIIVFAPGSLFTSIIPIFRVPGLAREVRKNKGAMKILVANIWVQKGETDVVRGAPGRRYWATDLVRSYDANIEGGVGGMFSHILALGMRDIPGNILQRYAVEDKTPIYLDRERLESAGFIPIEAGIYSQRALKERRVIQHDPPVLSKAIRVLWALQSCRGGTEQEDAAALPQKNRKTRLRVQPRQVSCRRYARLAGRLANIRVQRAGGGTAGDASMVRERLLDILWRHADVDEAHLDRVDSLVLHPAAQWRRAQEWDNIFSFYDPEARAIRIREDMLAEPGRFEIFFLVALGQSLLGDYAAAKEIQPLSHLGGEVGKLYLIHLRPPAKRRCFLGDADLGRYLELARMVPATDNPLLYTRAINGREGFTPPGLLFGLFYAWYLDNRFATHIEYKMALLRHQVSALVPEQVRARDLRRAMVDFFRQRVFGYPF